MSSVYGCAYVCVGGQREKKTEREKMRYRSTQVLPSVHLLSRKVQHFPSGCVCVQFLHK